MTKIILRPAVFEDWALLLNWVNQPDSLAWKFRTTDPIDADSHKAWLKRFLDDDEGRIFILLLTDEHVGQIRFQPGKEDVFEIDVFVTSEHRGGGVAQRALEQGMTNMTAERASTQPRTRFQAEVLRDNHASHNLFQRLGFTEIARNNNHVMYELMMKAGQT